MKLDKIGTIHSVYKEKGDAPRQGSFDRQESKIEIFPKYIDAMYGINKDDKIVVLYWGDRSDRSILKVIRPFDKQLKGIFATRSPNRPNPIALCICEIVKIEDNILTVVGLDALDNSPLLDIKIHF